MIPAETLELEVDYPSSDGKPMAETGIHVLTMMRLHLTLMEVLAESWFIASDMFWYYREGDRKARVAPDTMIAPDGGRAFRRSFFSWKEKKDPVVVFEMASKGTWRADLTRKKELYQTLGVREYFIYDPEDIYLEPRFQGFRLNRKGVYRPMTADPTDGSLKSEELRLIFQPDSIYLRMIDAVTGRIYLSPEERSQQAKASLLEETRRADEIQKAFEQQKELTEREKQNAEREKQNAEREKQNAEREKHSREQAQERADALQAELERLRQQLRTSGETGS